MNSLGAEPSLYGKKPYQSIHCVKVRDKYEESRHCEDGVVSADGGGNWQGGNMLIAISEIDRTRTIVILVGEALSQEFDTNARLAEALCCVLKNARSVSAYGQAGLRTASLTDWKLEAGKVAMMLRRLDENLQDA